MRKQSAGTGSLYYQKMTAEQTCRQPIVLLHGLFGMSDNLKSLGGSLRKSRDVILPDLVNHGRSFHRREMTLTEMAGDVLLLMDDLGIKNLSVLGHSLGGKVGMQIALMAPERIASLVVLDIAPVVYPDRHSCFFTALRQIESNKPHTRKEAERMLEEAGMSLPYRQFFLKSLKKDANDRWEWCFGLDEIIDAYNDICCAPVMTKPFSGSVLFVKGGMSDYIIDAHIPELFRLFPNAIIETIPDAGHWLHFDNPVLTGKRVIDFLDSY